MLKNIFFEKFERAVTSHVKYKNLFLTVLKVYDYN